MSQKMLYVLDTNVLLYDPESLNAFPLQEVIVPIDVIEEIDKFKEVLSETGNSARTVAQMLDRYRHSGNLFEGITLPNKGRLRVGYSGKPSENEKSGIDWSKRSNRVLRVALRLKEAGNNVTLVTLDTNLRVKGNTLGISVTNYHEEQKTSVSAYTGLQYMDLPEKELTAARLRDTFTLKGEFAAHEGVLLANEKHEKDVEMGVYDAKQEHFIRVNHSQGVWDIKPRNAEQHLALELLLNPLVPIVTLVGKAGTGKTLLALAAGLQLMLVENQYSRLLVSRPIFPMGRDLGYLPGDLQEKLAPWMQPIFDNLEFLLGSSTNNASPNSQSHQELVEQGLLVIEPLTYIRGRSIPHQYMIVDEAQNLTPHEIKTIITRVGEGTKIILTGDPDQIDNPYVNKVSNGLSYIVEKFKNQTIAGHITLKRGERSPLAELAANIL